MIETRLFEHVPETGTTRWFHYNDETDEVTIESEQDVTELVEANKAMFNSVDERAGWKGDTHLVGRIPINMYWDLVKKGLISKSGVVLNQEEVSKAVTLFLNDSNNRAFRVRPGRI